MKNLLSCVLLSSFILVLNLFASDDQISFAKYKVITLDQNFINYNVSFDKREASLAEILLKHEAEIKKIKKFNFDTKIPKEILNTKLKSMMLMQLCPSMGGEKVSLTISGKVSNACKVPLPKLNKNLRLELESIEFLKLTSKENLDLEIFIYFSSVPVYGIAKIESKFVSMVIDDYKW